jgi:hypothetical protein
MLSPCCLCVYESPAINFSMPKLIFVKVGKYIIAPEPISTAYFISVSHQSVCLYVHVARQRLRKNFTSETNTQVKIKKVAGRVVFYTVLVSKESRRLVLHYTYC